MALLWSESRTPTPPVHHPKSEEHTDGGIVGQAEVTGKSCPAVGFVWGFLQPPQPSLSFSIVEMDLQLLITQTMY